MMRSTRMFVLQQPFKHISQKICTCVDRAHIAEHVPTRRYSILAAEDYWIKRNFARGITILPATARDSTINSVQSGILLESSLHQMFDTYIFSINPGAWFHFLG